MSFYNRWIHTPQQKQQTRQHASNTDAPETAEETKFCRSSMNGLVLRGQKNTLKQEKKSLVNPHHNLGIYASGTEAAARFIDADLIRWL